MRRCYDLYQCDLSTIGEMVGHNIPPFAGLGGRLRNVFHRCDGISRTDEISDAPKALYKEKVFIDKGLYGGTHGTEGKFFLWIGQRKGSFVTGCIGKSKGSLTFGFC